MACLSSVDDSEWPEVNRINSFAVFSGYLLMGIRGLGLLVVAWNTAVLLGGFVTDLETTDFWCLTAIGFIQAVGVVDFVYKEKFTEVLFRLFRELLDSFGKITGDDDLTLGKITGDDDSTLWLVIKILRCLILICLLAPVPVLGLYISTGISTWRLIQHNYGNASGSANLKPAVYGLYSLAVAQGMLYIYKTIDSIITRAKIVARKYNSVDAELVVAYLNSTVAGCKKDTSFATGRNFVTYAVDLMMESKSNGNFIDGIRLLGEAIKPGSPLARLVLAKHLLTRSAFSHHLIQKLLETLGPRSPYSKEIREHAARIVALVARGMHLAQFPRAIRCVSSLLVDEFHGSEPGGRLPKEYERGWLLEKFEREYLVQLEHERPDSTRGDENKPLLGYTRLVIQGLRILQKLAVDEDNYGLIINTQGLLSKIIKVSLISNQLHRGHHDEWCNMVDESLKLMSRLMAAAPEMETMLRGEISSNMGAIVVTLESILECSECSLLEKRKAIEILLLLDPHEDVSSTMAGASSSRTFKWMLLAIFLLSQNNYIRKLAGEKLQCIPSLQSEGSATRTLESVGVVLDDLTTTLVDGNHEDRLDAAQILEHLCLNCSNDNTYLKQLKQAMVDVMPKVLKQIFDYATRKKTHAVTTEANNDQFSLPSIDLENPGASQEDGEQQEDSKLREAFIHLCWVIWVKWYKDPDITTDQLDEIAAKVCLEHGKPVERFGEQVKPVKLFGKLVRELLKRRQLKN